MGAQKQRWSAEEEVALRAGVNKHGSGKWCTILRDPEFSSVLRFRSNVDLKDKWRNLNVTAGGFGSREKGRTASKKAPRARKNENSAIVLHKEADESDEKFMDAELLSSAYDPIEIDGSQKTIARLDDLILEAIETLNESSGSNKTTITSFIEEQYWSPMDFKRLLSLKLKSLETCGKILKVNHRYRLTPASAAKLLRYKENQSTPLALENGTHKQTTKLEVDAELACVASMAQQDLADFAAKAVAAAEIAMAEAEEANRVAEAAEAEAEEAKAFARAAAMSLSNRAPFFHPLL